MAKDVKSILAEMERIGALGGPEPKPVVPVAVAVAEPGTIQEVEVEQAAPGPVLKDARGAQMIELLDSVIGQLEVLQASFRDMRQLWQTEDVADTPAGDRADRALRAARALKTGRPNRTSAEHAAKPEPAPPQSARGPLPGDLAPKVPTAPPGTADAAREAALDKIRAGDHSDPAQFEDPDDEDDGIPFVGSERAMPPGVGGNDEVSLRTIPISGKD